MRPVDLKYTETHEWVRLDKKGFATIGITDYAVKQLSDLVHIELPKVGEKAEQGQPFGEIESVKTVADLVAPLTGKITEVNKEVLEDIDALAEDPFEEGWLIKVKLDDTAETGSLMTSKEYKEFLEAAQEDEKEEDETKEKDDGDDVDEDDFM